MKQFGCACGCVAIVAKVVDLAVDEAQLIHTTDSKQAFQRIGSNRYKIPTKPNDNFTAMRVILLKSSIKYPSLTYTECVFGNTDWTILICGNCGVAVMAERSRISIADTNHAFVNVDAMVNPDECIPLYPGYCPLLQIIVRKYDNCASNGRIDGILLQSEIDLQHCKALDCKRDEVEAKILRYREKLELELERLDNDARAGKTKLIKIHWFVVRCLFAAKNL